MKFKKYEAFVNECPFFDDYALGLAGEVGEVLEHIKKHRRTGERHQPIDREAFKKELGDVLWYLTKTANIHDITLSEIAETNMEKLTKRHNING